AEKNTPDSPHIGSTERFIRPDTASIVLARDAISRPNEPNATALSSTIPAMVSHDPRIGTPKIATDRPTSTPTSITSRTMRDSAYATRYSVRTLGLSQG